MKKTEAKKRKSPSREKYEKENPTVSGRMPKEKRDRFYANLAKSGRSVSDAMNSLADDLELKIIPIDEARGQGFEDAMKLYMVTYPCNICGNPIHITSRKAKDAVMRYMVEHRWGHAECHERTRQP
ncbi:MAG: hypothetical protein JRJ77_14745 [Deltaproteobacteria bacterium]|nr:hypothetical protein [Deltaproteobacteria bacterium]